MDETLCKTCKHGLVLSVSEANEIDRYTFCNVLATPIKFTGAKKVVECTLHSKNK